MTEDQISEQIALWQQTGDHQPHEVAIKFAFEARTYLRAGKTELAERKMRAAIAVATGEQCASA
jgi:hypothetical protein